MTTRHPSTPSPREGGSSSGELRDLITHLLAGVAGGSEAKWRRLVGEVEALPIVFHPRSGLARIADRDGSEQAAIEKAVAVVRDAHPYVALPKAD